jgi:hypothetical protein
MPDQANRIVARTEMPHVGVKCLGPGHTEKNATQNEKTRIAVREQITQTIKRVQGSQRPRYRSSGAMLASAGSRLNVQFLATEE